jgi:hypothetical protein
MAIQRAPRFVRGPLVLYVGAIESGVFRRRG